MVSGACWFWGLQMNGGLGLGFGNGKELRSSWEAEPKSTEGHLEACVMGEGKVRDWTGLLYHVSKAVRN